MLAYQKFQEAIYKNNNYSQHVYNFVKVKLETLPWITR